MKKLILGRGFTRSRGWKRLLAFVSVAVVLVVATACGDSDGGGSEAGGEELKEVHIGLSGGSLGFYGYFVAESQGYFEDEGIDVTLTSTSGSSESAQQLAAGNFDIADGGADAFLQAMTEVDLYPFYNYWPKEYRTWSVPEDSDFAGPEDLAGTTVGVSDLAGGEVPIIRWVLEQAGVLDSVEIVAVSEEPAVVQSSFEKDRIQSYGGPNAVIIALRSQGLPLRSIMPESLEEGPVAPLFASEEIKDDTELLAGVGRAISKGKLFCLVNVEACVDIIGQDHPELVEDRDLAIETVEGYFPITAPEMVDGKYYFGGTNTVEGWENYIGIYSSGEDPLLPDPSLYHMEDLIIDLDDEINDFDYDAIVEEAENYSA